jgi:hypothetical protein
MRTMTDDEWDSFLTAADRVDANECRARYGGRGMYGDKCIAVVLEDEGDAVRFGASLVEEGLDWVAWQGRPAMDSMGRSVVLYFEGVAAPEGAGDEDEEDEDY